MMLRRCARGSGPSTSLLAPTLPFQSLFRARNASSLSAIHDGLRQSERARPQGYGRPSGDRGDYSPVDFKIRKGKKDISEAPKQKPPTRAARFYDPNDPFGKKSLVYQLKSGQLDNELAGISPKDDPASNGMTGFWDKFEREMPQKSRDGPSRGGGRDFGGRGKTASRGFGLDFSGREDRSRGFDRERREPGRWEDRSSGPGDRSRGFGQERRESRPWEDRSAGPGDRSRGFGQDKRESRPWEDRSAGQGDISRDFGQDRREPRPWEDRSTGQGNRSRGFGLDTSESRPWEDRSSERDGQERGFDRERGGFRPRDEESFGRGDRSRDFDRDRSRFGRDERPREGRDRTEPPRWDQERRDDGPGYGQSSSSYSSGSRGRSQPTMMSVPYTTAASQFLYGRFVVEEALRSSRRKLYTLYIYTGENRRSTGQDAIFEKLALDKGVKVVKLGEADQVIMNKMSEGRPHNGLILEASPISQPPIESLGALSEAEAKETGFHVTLGHQSAEDLAINGSADFVPTENWRHKPLVLFLDRILDPGNLGAMLRTASFLGVGAVVISQRNSATLTSVAIKAAAGATETMPLFACDNTAKFLHESSEAGWKVYAAVAPSRGKKRQQDVYDIEDEDPLATDPCILVVGSEGEGLPVLVKSRAHHAVSIPNASGAHTIDSLNVSVATGLLCGAFMRGQAKEKNPRQSKKVQTSGELGIW